MMAKLFKVTAYYLNVEGNHNTVDDLVNTLERGADNVDLSMRIVSVSESEEVEWSDDIDINFINATDEQYEKYIK